MLAVHWEASTHLHRTIHISDLDMLWCSVKSTHPVTLLEDIIQDLDFVLIMSVNPGFGGQEFIKKSLDRIKELKALIIRNNSDALIEVDGGVNQDNCLSLVEAGADILVAGNAIFKAEDPLVAIQNIRNCTTEK